MDNLAEFGCDGKNIKHRYEAERKAKGFIMVTVKTRKITNRFADECVIYYSRPDKCWIAHSLHTDQIGTGNDVLTALVELMETIGGLVVFSKSHKDIAVRREAPKAVWKRVEKAIPIPDELCEIARKRILGEWPKEIKLIAEPTRKHSLIAKITKVASLSIN